MQCLLLLISANLAKLLASPVPLSLVDIRHDNPPTTGENSPAELLPKAQICPGNDEVPLHLSVAFTYLFVRDKS